MTTPEEVIEEETEGETTSTMEKILPQQQREIQSVEQEMAR